MRMKQKTSNFKYVLKVLYTLSLAVFFFFLFKGGSYYLTPLSERPLHPDFRVFKPAGSLGLLFGIVGTAMMFSLLLYSLRKRTRLFGRIFLVKHWLDVHILCGIMGPLFILLHTSFKLGGLVAASFWSMMAVASSGLFGRYLYVQIPRNIRGDEIGVRELEEQNEVLSKSLQTDFALTPELVEEMMAALYGAGGKSGEAPTLLQMITGDIRGQWQLRRARTEIPVRFNIPPESAEALVETALRKATLSRRIGRLRKVHKLFHHWHVIHRPFALIMYLIAIIHIVVALLFGISWRVPS